MTSKAKDVQALHGDRRLGYIQTGVILSFAILSGAICAWFVSMERCVYVWDFSGYWNIATSLAQTFRQSPANAVNVIFHSIANDEYNVLPIIPVSLAMLIVGDGRAAYVACVGAIYGPAVLAALVCLCKSLAGKFCADGLTAVLLPAAVLVCCPLYWTPILRGCPDIIGLLPLLLAARIYFARPLAEQKLRAWFYMGLLLASAILLRRWYIYWVVGFFAIAGVEWLIFVIRNRQKLFKVVASGAIAMGLMLVSVALPICALAWPMVRRIASSNYGMMYSAYKYHANLWDATMRMIQYAGLFHVVILIMAAGVAAMVRPARRVVIFLLVQFIVVCILFYRLQGMGIHHYYLFAPVYLAIVSLAGIAIVRLVRNLAARLAAPILYFTGMLACCAVVFLPALAWAKSSIFPSDLCYPMRRGDVQSLMSLTARLDELTGASKDRTIYILASSYTLCDETLRNAPRSLGITFHSAENVERTSHVDLRDGFSPGLLKAEIIVLAKPIQYHLVEQHQRMISLPAASLILEQNIGKAFKRLPDQFQLDNGVTVSLYEKVRPPTKEETDELLRLFRRVYPDHYNLFEAEME